MDSLVRVLPDVDFYHNHCVLTYLLVYEYI